MKREEYKSMNFPSGYKRLEYIESTGTQYIDTGVSDLNMLRISTNIMFTKKGLDQAMGWGNSNYLEVFRFNSNNGSKFTYLLGNDSNTITTIGDADLEWHVWDLQSGMQKFDDDIIGTRTITSKGNVFYLFSLHAGWTSALTAPCHCKMNYFKMWLNGSLVRDYAPALRLNDNKPGLYDLCESVCPLTGTPFYVNSGAGEFLYK